MELEVHLAALITCICTVMAEPLRNKYESNLTIHQEMCDLYGKSPFFEVDAIAGKTWRIYYSWNIEMRHQCLELTFQKPTTWTVNRFWSDMNEYLMTQPSWDAATLLMIMGNSNHQMLLFAVQGPAGRLEGVPNLRRDNNIMIPKKSVPLLNFQFKLVNVNGVLFLVVMDCNIGVTTLSSSVDEDPPFKVIIYAASFTVPYHEGNQACIGIEHRAEKLYRLDYGTVF